MSAEGFQEFKCAGCNARFETFEDMDAHCARRDCVPATAKEVLKALREWCEQERGTWQPSFSDILNWLDAHTKAPGAPEDGKR